jgi:hypothetical protein
LSEYQKNRVFSDRNRERQKAKGRKDFGKAKGKINLKKADWDLTILNTVL